MKKGLLFICFFAFISQFAKAQIALTYDDTTICRGDTITMAAAVTGQASNVSGDDYFAPTAINIGFPFVFYGNTYTQCVISGNNFLSFNTALAGQYSSYTWAGATGNGNLNNVVMLAFQDLDLNYGGAVYYQTFGSPGSRRFVVQYCDVPKYGGNCHSYKVTNQVILYEGTNVIEFHTQNMPGSPGCPSTNGVNNAIQGLRYMGTTLNEIYTPGRNPTDMWGNTGGANTSRRFTPTAAAPFYVVDSIAFAPWNIIQQLNSNLLRWYDANGNFLTQASSLTVQVSNPPSPAPGTFFVVEYSGPAGCDNTQSFTYKDTVNVHFSDIKTYITQSMCAGSTYDFYGRTLYSPGTYDTIFPSYIGCDSTIILTLNVNPLPNATINGDQKVKICQGDAYLFRATKGSGYTYQWQRDGQNIPNATADTFLTGVAGVYTLNVTSNQGCEKLSKAVTLTIAPNPTVKINYISSDDICAMDTVTLSAMAVGQNLEYVWSPDEFFQRTSGSSTHSKVDAIIPHSGYVYVKVYNNDLCTAIDSAFIKAIPCCEMRVPSAFTPNNDGKNDYFLPTLEVGQKVILFQVVDRYGKMVFQSENFNTRGWDGKYPNGDLATGGVYMYVLRYACSDGKNYEKKGDITLMR